MERHLASESRKLERAKGRRAGKFTGIGPALVLFRDFAVSGFRDRSSVWPFIRNIALESAKKLNLPAALIACRFGPWLLRVEIATRRQPETLPLRMAISFLEKFTGMFKDRRIDVAERFELLREAISGTMSSFYMAKDRKTGKTVGLKILDPEKCAAVRGPLQIAQEAVGRRNRVEDRASADRRDL